MFRSLFSAIMLAALFVYAAFSAEIKAGDLVIIDPVVRATGAAAPVSGGYMTIKNLGNTPDRLLSATSDFSGITQIHEMTMVEDVMKMRELKNGIEIPAGGEIVLKRGGNHLMFMQLEKGISPDGTYKGSLVFEKAGKIDVEFSVLTQ